MDLTKTMAAAILEAKDKALNACKQYTEGDISLSELDTVLTVYIYDAVVAIVDEYDTTI